MKILAVNCGSSSLKFTLFSGDRLRLLSGSYREIGSDHSVLKLSDGLQKTEEVRSSFPSHEAAWSDLVSRIERAGNSAPIDAVGYRIVHGGRDFRATTRLDAAAADRIAALSELAPLHNDAAIRVIRAGLNSLGPEVARFGVFDTAFHSQMPLEAVLYPIPLEYYEKFAVQRYGFHGLAHRSMLEISAGLAGCAPNSGRVITLQLGNGCSGCAIVDGRSIDTSMGFSPLEGLMMGSRSGDIDPMVVAYLHRVTGKPYDEIFSGLNRKSGLLGVSGTSSDMAQLMAESSNGRKESRLAIDLFTRRVTKLIGSYLALLGGADRLVFGGGIGANSPDLRERITSSLTPLGVTLDPARNRSAAGNSALISAESSAVRVYSADVDEESIIFNDVTAALAAA